MVGKPSLPLKRRVNPHQHPPLSLPTKTNLCSVPLSARLAERKWGFLFIYFFLREIGSMALREMAQASKICSNGASSTHIFPNVSKPSKPRSTNSVSLRSQFTSSSNYMSLKHKNGGLANFTAARNVLGPVKISGSVATTEKPSTVPEIVIQPIKEISGTIKLPGSKSLSNRILLLSALSEVWKYCGFMCKFVIFKSS